MTDARGCYHPRRSSSNPSSSRFTTALISSIATPHIVSSPPTTSLPVDILGDVSLACPPLVPSPIVVVAPTFVPIHAANSSVVPSSHSTVGSSRSESQHVIELDSDGSIFCRKVSISHFISTIFKKCLHKEGHVWKEVPSEMKDFYWNEFAKTFQWDPAIDAMVRREWAQKVAKRYFDNIHRWHAKGKPAFVPDDMWDRWIQKWEQDDAFKKRSAHASLNHLNKKGCPGIGPSHHSGGFISSAEQKRQMLLEQATQLDEGSKEPREPSCNQIFFQVVGGKNKKKRIYDTTSLSQSKFSEVDSSSTVSSGLNENSIIQEMTENINLQMENENLIIQEMTKRINLQTEKINSQQEKINLQAQELKDIRRQMSEMRALIEQLTASTRGMLPSFSNPQLTR